MQELIESLRNAANAHPLDVDLDLLNQAADAIEKLRHLEAGAIEIRCTKQRWADELESIKKHKNKIKAEAIRDWADQTNPQNESEDRMIRNAEDYADKLERGEL